MFIETAGAPRTRALTIIETHPIQYRAPVYRALAQRYKIPATVIYGSDFSVSGYYDPEFRSQFAWDTDLLSGYAHTFLARTAGGGRARTYDTVSAHGMARAIRDLDPAAILLVGYSPRFHQWAWLHAWRSRRPILFRGETADRAQTGGTIRLGVRARLLQSLYRRCSRVLYIGQRSRDHFSSYGCPENKLVFSPYCVDTGPFDINEDSRRRLRPKARLSLGIAEDDKVILFSGKLSERKGPDLLIEAVRALPEKDRLRTTILFMGSGEMLPLLEASAKLEPRVDARFLGFQNQQAISPWFHAADLFVLPSRRLETWGLVVNEALHHGLPCITSEAVGCTPDLITPGVTGEVCETGSASSLSAAIVRAGVLIGQDRIREACRKRIEAYSVDKAAEGIALAYESSLG